MKLRSGSLDDIHAEASFWLEELNIPYARVFGQAMAAAYRAHRPMLLLLVDALCRRSRMPSRRAPREAAR